MHELKTTKRKQEEVGFRYFRREALKAAKDLLYSEKVIENIKDAESCNEITQIMWAARKGGDNCK